MALRSKIKKLSLIWHKLDFSRKGQESRPPDPPLVAPQTPSSCASSPPTLSSCGPSAPPPSNCAPQAPLVALQPLPVAPLIIVWYISSGCVTFLNSYSVFCHYYIIICYCAKCSERVSKSTAILHISTRRSLISRMSLLCECSEVP